MLPKRVTELTANFVQVFDADRPAVIEFRKARNQVYTAQAQRHLGWGTASLYDVGRRITAYLQAKAEFIWAKLKEVVISTEIETYPDLAKDLKSLLETYYHPALGAAERYLEELRNEAHAPPGHTIETKAAFRNILSRINAEIDLFCAAYAVRKNESPNKQVFNIGAVHGTVGNTTNSQVIVYDYGSISQLLIDRQIPKEDRRELEDIMDELKDAPTEKKKSLLQRAEGWVVKHKDVLGAGAEAVGRAMNPK